METDSIALSTISDKTATDLSTTTKRTSKSSKRSVKSTDEPLPQPNGNAPKSPSRKRNKSRPVESTKSNNQIEVTSITDEDEEHDQPQRFESEPPSQSIPIDQATMLSSYTTGGENDVIEIHQFSLNDLDDYLDIYFETLDNRLRHHVGTDDQLQQFRLATKNRINSNPNAREFQNVLLGKMNGDVVAAVTMAFPGETPTIPPTSNGAGGNSCFRSIRNWMARKANYMPTNMEECYIEMIGVKKTYQNRGIGAAMLECVEHFARQASATILTIHVYGDQLRNYFERYGFEADTSDSSGFWKWAVERQSVTKLSKVIPAEENANVDYSNGSYLNESMAESLDE